MIGKIVLINEQTIVAQINNHNAITIKFLTTFQPNKTFFCHFGKHHKRTITLKPRNYNNKHPSRNTQKNTPEGGHSKKQ
jgi:hypothetical protein